MLIVKRDLCGDVDVGNTVPISHTESVLTFEKRLDSLQAPASHGVRACLDQRHPPRLRIVPVNVDLVAAKIDRHVRRVKEVI